jgi:hypothetical protein
MCPANRSTLRCRSRGSRSNGERELSTSKRAPTVNAFVNGTALGSRRALGQKSIRVLASVAVCTPLPGAPCTDLGERHCRTGERHRGDCVDLHSAIGQIVDSTRLQLRKGRSGEVPVTPALSEILDCMKGAILCCVPESYCIPLRIMRVRQPSRVGGVHLSSRHFKAFDSFRNRDRSSPELRKSRAPFFFNRVGVSCLPQAEGLEAVRRLLSYHSCDPLSSLEREPGNRQYPTYGPERSWT